VATHFPDDLGDQLDSSLAWRRVEMQSIKSALQDAAAKSVSSPLTRALARSIVAMTYAHWEGYTKEVCQAYVKYIARRRPKCSDLNDGLLISSMKHLNRRMTSGDAAARLALIEAVRRPADARARIPPDTTLVDTKSNLRFDTLRTIFDSLGISVQDFETKANFIDKSLCDMRNAIAHGRDAFPPAADALDLYEEVLELMEKVRDRIMAEVRTSGYGYIAQADVS
jgi:MAE_28990/MAE_18760-like HEPN